MSFQERVTELHQAGEITEEEMRTALADFNRSNANKMLGGLLEHFDGDQQKVTDFLMTHKVPIIDDVGSGKFELTFAPHHDDLETVTLVLSQGSDS